MSIRGPLRVALPVLLAATLAVPASSTISNPGRWTVSTRWSKAVGDTFSETAVNMILLALPPDSTGHTQARIMYWQDDHEAEGGASDGGYWDWSVPSDSLLDSGSFPDTTTSGTFRFRRYPSPGYNIFCSGMTPLEEDEGYGRLLVVGGTEEAENGSAQASVYDARTNSWSSTGNQLSVGRWYPTATMLANGKALVTSGSRYESAWLFGGNADPSDTTDKKWYFDPVTHDAAKMWNQEVVPDSDVSFAHAGLPKPRRGQSACWQIGGTLAIYGGRTLATGKLLGDFWMLRPGDNPDKPDFSYTYENRTPAAGSDDPQKLAYQTSQVLSLGTSSNKLETLIMVGGQIDTVGPAASSDKVWAGRLVNNSYTINWQWSPPTIDSAPFPGRFGHASVWDANLERMFVYGGVAEPGALPSDPDVYSLEFVNGDVDSIRWRKCVVENPTATPAPRAFMAAGDLPCTVKLSSGAMVDRHAMAIYGGRTSSDVVSDSMFVLVPVDETTVRWVPLAQSGTHPALEYASGTVVTNFEEFRVLGGKDASGSPQSAMMWTPLKCDHCDPDSIPISWQPLAGASHAVWGHSFAYHRSDVFARTSEVYDPATNGFTVLNGAYRKEDWYPQTFTIPGQPDEVFVSGPLDSTNGTSGAGWTLTLAGSSGSWSTVQSPWSGFRGGSAVMYRPGRILKCGSRDTDGQGAAHGASAILDLTAPSPSWTPSDSMIPRVNMNLVALPDGTVLVVGGTGEVDNQDNKSPVTQPEIWDPAEGSAGTWEGGDGTGVRLDASSVVRGYHSTALLLPDGRVLCAGGNATDSATAAGRYWVNDQYRTDIYSPPYLFNADGTPATRPALMGAPRRVSYGEPFTIHVHNDAFSAKVVLIRAGAVTHAYDENQRYVELSSSYAGSDASAANYFRVWAPTDSSTAPPGDYLLFVLNSQGTPSIARWVRLGRGNGSTGAPTAVTDLLEGACLDGPDVMLRWTPPGADQGDSLLGPAARYDIRCSPSSMDTWGQFTGGAPVTPPPPGDPYHGVKDQVTIRNLTVGSTYYFRLAAKNSASNEGNWSALSNQLSLVIHDDVCGGSGGGGGGGQYGTRARPGAQATSIYKPGAGGTQPDSTWLENTLLPNVPLNTTETDRILLPLGPRWTTSGARVRLSQGGTRSTHFDRVRLLAADYAEGEDVFVRAGALVGGATHNPVRVVHADGRDLTDSLLAGSGFDGRDGDTLYVETGEEGPGSVVLSTSRAQLVRAPDHTGIDLACESAGGWVAIGHHEERERSSDEVFDAPGIRRVRLVFHGVHKLEWVGTFTPGPAVTVTAFDPVAATHSRLGDVTADLAGDGTTLASGDQLLVDYAAAPPASGTLRQWFLEATGAPMEGGSGLQASHLGGPSGAPPAVFALARSRPNPFAGTTTIGFDVPRRSHVRLEVFDVLGRRVATLADREYAPGRFSVAWDGRTSAGTVARAGVYLCRMSAGSFRSEQHLVLIR